MITIYMLFDMLSYMKSQRIKYWRSIVWCL